MDVPYMKVELPPIASVIPLLHEIWERGVVTNGGPLQHFAEEQLSRLFSGHVMMSASGTAALQLTLATLERRGEVVVSAFTHPATVQAILRSGNVPIFADLLPGSVSLDPSSVESRITKRTIAVMPTHVFGLPACVTELARLSDTYGVDVIYDGASSAGVSYMGKPLSSYGSACAVSMHATKIINGVEAGAIVSANSALVDRARKLANFGMSIDSSPMGGGFNGKSNEIAAAMCLASLPGLGVRISSLKSNHQHYASSLGSIERIRILTPDNNTEYNYCTVAALISAESADPGLSVQRALAAEGIETRRYFAGQYAMPVGASSPNSEEIKSSILCLPTWPGMHPSVIDHVCDEIANVLDSMTSTRGTR